jgi:hypothetical protein
MRGREDGKEDLRFIRGLRLFRDERLRETYGHWLMTVMVGSQIGAVVVRGEWRAKKADRRWYQIKEGSIRCDARDTS